MTLNHCQLFLNIPTYLPSYLPTYLPTIIIGDPVVDTDNPPDLPMASSLMSQPPYGTQNDH